MKYLTPLLAVIAGVLVIVWSDAALTIIAIYLILVGLLGLAGKE
jgi:hypothetical protein